MGGDIEVYSKLNKGSMFDVALPLGPLKGHEKFTEQASILLHDFRVFVHIRHEILREYVEKWLFHCNAKIVTVPPADISISDVSDIVILGIKTSLIPRSDFSCARLMEALAISIGKLENSIIPPHLTKFLNIGRGRKVLLVDDDAICRKIIQEQVMLLGFVVRAEESGYAALTAWREEIFDLTLMDLKLGDIHGYQLARKIRATDNWINYPCCFCILSAYSENKERERYIEEGFAGFIQKPCTVEQLADLLPSYMLHAGR
ncbi:hypothetical protein CXB49_00125 [Chromobacterium sp. ATCC 53434]|nr:hypothetical protein CXB49_00125 [Chromobacterium sp. ATCC 53434]